MGETAIKRGRQVGLISQFIGQGVLSKTITFRDLCMAKLC